MLQFHCVGKFEVAVGGSMQASRWRTSEAIAAKTRLSLIPQIARDR